MKDVVCLFVFVSSLFIVMLHQEIPLLVGFVCAWLIINRKVEAPL